MTARVCGQTGGDLEGVRDAQVRFHADRGHKILVHVTFDLVPLTLGDSHAGARRQRHRAVPAGRLRDGIVRRAPGFVEFTPRQGGLSDVSAV